MKKWREKLGWKGVISFPTMSFNSSTPSLWDQCPAQDVVHKFTTMAVASPHGVEGLATGALSPPPPSRSDQATERITELARYFFKEGSGPFIWTV